MFDLIPSPWRPDSGVPLSDATLRLHSHRVDVPTYDRSSLQRGVVHIGAGNFHRAHQAVYFDDLARSRISDRWGVTGVSLRSRDVKDKWPVVTEPYRQWVIEDSFCNGRPPLAEVGAEFVADVRDHKLIKTRVLNGTHIALGCLATLAGYRRTDEAMRTALSSITSRGSCATRFSRCCPQSPG